MDPAEATAIHDDVNSRRSFGIHWGTFSLTYEHYHEPKELLQALALDQGQDFRAIGIGETIEGG